MYNDVSKRDWKLFREKLPGWQEAYMNQLIHAYDRLINDESLPASQRFWELEKRIRSDKEKPGVVMEMDKKQTYFSIACLIHDGAITMDDLADFSDTCRQCVENYLDTGDEEEE